MRTDWTIFVLIWAAAFLLGVIFGAIGVVGIAGARASSRYEEQRAKTGGVEGPISIRRLDVTSYNGGEAYAYTVDAERPVDDGRFLLVRIEE